MMNSPTGYARGTISREGQVRTDMEGRPYLEATIEMEGPTQHRGRQFRQRVALRSFRPADIGLARELTRGVRVSIDATGVDAVSWTDRATGQVFSTARLTGHVTILHGRTE
jgi:hypothetical protein